jgi:hypothetical protein
MLFFKYKCKLIITGANYCSSELQNFSSCCSAARRQFEMTLHAPEWNNCPHVVCIMKPSSSGHYVGSVSVLFRPHDSIHQLVLLTVVQVFVFRYVDRSCFRYLMSSILLIWFNHLCLYCANLFLTGSTLSSSRTSSFLLCFLIKCNLPCVSWIPSLLSLVSLCLFVSVSRFHGHVNVMDRVTKMLREVVFGSKTLLRIPRVCESVFIFFLMSISLVDQFIPLYWGPYQTSRPI